MTNNLFGLCTITDYCVPWQKWNITSTVVSPKEKNASFVSKTYKNGFSISIGPELRK